MGLKNKIFFYKGLLIEICETLASICLYLEYDARRMHNPMGQHMRSHFNELTEYSRELRDEQAKMLRKHRVTDKDKYKLVVTDIEEGEEQ